MQLFELVFSPTGGTRRVADLLAGELPGAALLVDLTDPAQAFGSVRIDAQDLALIAVPAYGGRVPAAAAERLRAVQGNGARAVLVAAYGNRAFEDTLVELEDLARQAGFRVAAAVAAVAEHSIDRATAAGRPDAQDAAELAEFGRRIAAKLTAGGGAPRLPEGCAPRRAIPSALVPRCPVCGRPMTMNLRADDSFVEDEGWHAAAGRYNDFMRRHEGQHILFLELGVGGNTPTIIKYNFWRMTAQNPQATYACLNLYESFCPQEIASRSICVRGDIDGVVRELQQEQPESFETFRAFHH